MAESKFTIPIDTDDKVSVKRLLIDLANTLDALLGITEEEDTISVVSLQEAINTVEGLITEVEGSLEVIVKDITDLENVDKSLQFALVHEALGTLYNDFDDAAWGSLSGNGQFTALGSAMTNPPFAVVAGTTYTVYIESYQTAGGGVVQRVLMEETGVTLTAHYRTGDSFAVAVTNGWIAL